MDLDGTLIHSDTLHEALLKVIRHKPYLLALIPFWLLQGKAKFKKKYLAMWILMLLYYPITFV